MRPSPYLNYETARDLQRSNLGAAYLSIFGTAPSLFSSSSPPRRFPKTTFQKYQIHPQRADEIRVSTFKGAVTLPCNTEPLSTTSPNLARRQPLSVPPRSCNYGGSRGLLSLPTASETLLNQPDRIGHLQFIGLPVSESSANVRRDCRIGSIRNFCVIETDRNPLVWQSRLSENRSEQHLILDLGRHGTCF